MPTSFPLVVMEVSVFSASPREVSSRVPNPSSMNSVSIVIPPLVELILSERPRARERDALKLSPPESVATSRFFPV